MEIDFEHCTEEQLWHYVATHLKQSGIDTILVGGAVVSIYSSGAYKSGDLDFVLGSLFVRGLEKALNEIGFHKQGRHYIHAACKHLFIEFPGTIPLGIGSDYSIKPDSHEIEGKVIKILSPTDCVKDRLATYLYFSDREGLQQAILIAQRQAVNMESIEAWCKNEKHPEIYAEFVNKLAFTG